MLLVSAGLMGTGLESMMDAAWFASCMLVKFASSFFLSNFAAIESVRRRAGRPGLLSGVDCMISVLNNVEICCQVFLPSNVLK